MPITDDEYASRYGHLTQYRADTPSQREHGWGDRLGAGVDAAQAQLWGIAEDLGSTRAGDRRKQNQFEGAYVRQRAIEDTGAPQSFRDVDGFGSGLKYIGGLAADSAPQLGASLAAGLVAGPMAGLSTAGRIGAGAAVAAPFNYGELLQGQREESGRTNRASALALTVPFTGLDMLGLDGMLASGKVMRTGLRTLDDMTGKAGVAARMGANTGLTSFTEGTSETGQEMLSQVGRMAVNPNQTLFNEDANERYLESFVGGAALGGAVSAPLGSWRKSAGYQPPDAVPPNPVEQGGPTDLLHPAGALDTSRFTSSPEFGLRVRNQFDNDAPMPAQAVAKREAEYRAMLATETGARVSDASTGLERAQTQGDLVDQVQPPATVQPPDPTRAPTIQEADRQGSLFSLEDAPLNQYSPLPEARGAGPTPDAATGDIFDQNPTSMVRTMFNSPTEPGREGRGNSMGAVAAEIRSQIAQQVGGVDAFATKMSFELAKRIGDVAASSALIQAETAKQEKEVAKLDRKVDMGSNLLTPEEYTVKREAIDRRQAVVAAAGQLVARHNGAMNSALAQEGAAKAQPGTTTGARPGTADSAAIARANSDAVLEEETRPDTEYSAPNEMDPGLVKERGPKGPAATLALRGQTPAQLAELNAREQWTAGPQEGERAQAPADLAQTNLFGPKGRPTKAATADPITQPAQPGTTGEGAGASRPTQAAPPVAEAKAPVAEAKAPVEPATPKGETGRSRVSNTDKFEMDTALELYDSPAEGDSPGQQKKHAQKLLDAIETLEGYANEPTENAATQAYAQKLLGDVDLTERDALKATATRYSHGTPSLKGRKPSLQAVQKLVEAFQKASRFALPIEVVANPAAVGIQFGGKVPPVGAFHNGRIYLFTDGIGSLAEAGMTMFHEVFHYGLSKTLSPAEYHATMARLNADPAIAKLAAEWKTSPEGVTAQKKMGAQAYDSLAIEEALAETSEWLTRDNNIGSKYNQPIRKVANWMANVADTLGLKPLAQAIRAMTQTQAEAFVAGVIKQTMGKSISARTPVLSGGTKPSAGTDQTETPAFKKWFGDSKVVDADGKPLVVYHGSVAENIDVFDSDRIGQSGSSLGRGFYAGQQFYASTYNGEDRTKSVTPLYVDIKNPLYFSDEKTAPNNAATDAANMTAYKAVKAVDPKLADQVFRLEGGRVAVFETFEVGEKNDGTFNASYERFERAMDIAGIDGVIDWAVAQTGPTKGQGYIHQVMARKNTQLKSATGNDGSFDATNPDIRYSQGRSTAGPKDVEGTTPAYTKMMDYLRWDVIGKSRRGVLASTFMRDLGARFGDQLKRVHEYVDTTFAMGAAAAELQKKAKAVQDALNALPDAQREAVLSLMIDATVGQVVVEPGNGRNNTHLNEAGMALAVKLHQEFKAMLPAQQAAYRLARDELGSNWKKRGDLLQRTAREIYDPLIVNATAAGNETQVRQLKREQSSYIADINARLAELKGDYFPLSRFGQFMVVRKSDAYLAQADAVDGAFKKMNTLLDTYDKNTPEGRKLTKKINKALEKAGEDTLGDFTPEQGAEIAAARKVYKDAALKLELMKGAEGDYFMARFETEGAAQREIKANGGELSLAQEQHKEINPISRAMLGRLEESMSATLRGSGNLTAMRDAKKAMYEVFLTSLPERSALKRQSKRKNTAGFSREMQRSIAGTLFKDSFYLSRMEHMDNLNTALNSVHQEAKDSKDTKLQEVSAELARRHAASMQYDDTPIQDALAATSYVYFLGVSPGFLISNMLQPFMVSAPMMMARHNAKTLAALGRAYADVSKVLAKSLKENPSGDITYDKAGLAPGEVAMLDEMLRQQLLQVTLTKELSQASEGRSQNKLMKAISLPSHHVEVVNRMATALAAYRLELGKTGSNGGATLYAQKVLADTHFDYSAENAPYWMKPGVVKYGKLAFQFKKYQVGMISLWVKNIAAMSKGATAAERAEAKKVVLGMLVTHGAVAGAMGLPAVGTLMFMFNLVAAAFGDDEPWDAEVAFRNFLHDVVGKDAGDVLAKGLPAMLDADLSRKVGLGGMLSVAPNLRTDKTGRDMYMELAASLMGPTLGGLGPRLFTGASDFANGDFVKGAENMLPKFLSDPIKAGRFLADGVTTRKGSALVQADDVGVWDAFLQASGVPSLQLGDAYAARAAIEGKKAALNDAKSTASRKWADARQKGDTERAQEIWVQVREEINPVRRKAGLPAITYSDLARYAQQRKVADAQYKQYGGRVGKNVALAEEGRFARD